MTDALRYLHLLAVAVGLGVAFLADASVLRNLKDPLSRRMLDTLDWTHRLVTGALVVMWLSGLALVYVRTGFVWDNISPKLIAKFVVVSVLSLNAALIAFYAMPRLQDYMGRPILSLPRKTLLPMAMISGVSTTSWLLALALGSSTALKTASADVFLALIPACYLASLVGSVIILALVRAKSAQHSHSPA